MARAIGADEWVARQDERRRKPASSGSSTTSPSGSRRPSASRSSWAAPQIFGIATSNEYYQRVGFNTLYYATPRARPERDRRVGGAARPRVRGLLRNRRISLRPSSTRRSSASALADPGHDGDRLPRLRHRGHPVSLPSRRLFGDYLAIITLFFGQIFFPPTTSFVCVRPQHHERPERPGGTSTRSASSGSTSRTCARYYYVALVVFTVVVIACSGSSTTRGPGRAWRSLREDTDGCTAPRHAGELVEAARFRLRRGRRRPDRDGFAALEVNIFPSDFDLPLLITVYAIVILGGAGQPGRRDARRDRRSTSRSRCSEHARPRALALLHRRSALGSRSSCGRWQVARRSWSAATIAFGFAVARDRDRRSGRAERRPRRVRRADAQRMLERWVVASRPTRREAGNWALRGPDRRRARADARCKGSARTVGARSRRSTSRRSRGRTCS